MWTRFEGIIITYSPKAVFFQGHYWEGGIWLPASQVRLMEDGDTGFIIDVRDWLTDKNGLLEFTPYSAEYMEALNAPR